MHSKTVIWIAFAVWSLICWRWYVCGIKDACHSSAQAAVTTPAIEPEPLPAAPATEPATSANNAANNAATNRANTPKQTQLEENNINSVQVVEMPDRVEIYFPYNSVQKEENDAIDEYLNRLAETLRSSGGKVTISGHTDGIGDARSNKELSLLRAKNIKRILVAKGAKSEQIKLVAYGESKPVATNDTPAGRYKNRRVVIRLD